MRLKDGGFLEETQKNQKNQSHISKSIAKPLEKPKKTKKTKDLTDLGHGGIHVSGAAWSGFGKSVFFVIFGFSNGFAMLFEMQL